MRSAEGIIDIKITKRGELAGETLIVRFLLGVEAEVFQEQALSILQTMDHLFHLTADTIRREVDRLVNQFGQSLSHRPEAQFGLFLSVGPPEMTHQNRAPAIIQDF